MTNGAPFGVLLVDDVADLRLMLRLSLEGSRRFAVVAEAEDGAKGVQLAGEHQPDLILLDIAMPVKDGLEALPALREVSPASRVVMLSGFEERQHGATALELGASAYLEKTLPPERLVDRLIEVMEAPPSP